MLSCQPESFSAFVRDLQIEGCDAHLYRGPNTFGGLLTETSASQLIESMEQENVYFLPGVRPGLRKRAADNDVMRRSMFTFDFDIRKELEKSKSGITEEALVSMADKIIAVLALHPIWGKMRYGVLSGNGLHMHYFGEPVEVNKEQWVAGMKDIFEEIAVITPIPPDFGCGNAGRIMRMPGSWNVKDATKRKPVTILAWNPEGTVPPLTFIQERGVSALAKKQERKAADRAEFEERSIDGPSGVIDLINRIPIEQVVEQLPLSCRVRAVKKDGGLRFCDDKGVERGFFRHRQYNIVVHEGTSLFDPPNGVGYNCLGLAKVVLKCSTKETIEWFCQRSATIRSLDAVERKSWKDNRAQLLTHALLDKIYG